MGSVSYVKIFNQLMDEFFKELIEIFPEETKLKVHYNYSENLIRHKYFLLMKTIDLFDKYLFFYINQ